MENGRKLGIGAMALFSAVGLWLGLWNLVYMISSWVPQGFALNQAQGLVVPSGIGWLICAIPFLVFAWWSTREEEVGYQSFWDSMMDAPEEVMKYAPTGAATMIWLVYPLFDGYGVIPSAVVGVLLVAAVAAFTGVAVVICMPLLLIFSALFDG